MRILIEHVKKEEMQSMKERLNGFCWRVLPPEIILYEPLFKLEGLPELPAGRKCG